MKNYFDLIVLIQSYPNLIHALNYALNNCDKKVLILINGDRNIFKFVNNIIKHENITTQIYGNNIFLTSRIFSWLLPIYVIYLNFRIPTFESNKKLITYSNWCNIGALFHFKTKSKIVSNLIAYQEERYTIQGIGTKNLPLYITILNFFTNDMLERKRYIYEEDGQTKSVESHSYGIRKRINISATIHAPREGEYSLIKESITTSVLIANREATSLRWRGNFGYISTFVIYTACRPANSQQLCVIIIGITVGIVR